MADRPRTPWRGGWVEVRDAVAADAEAFGPRLDAGDVAELHAAFGDEPVTGLQRCHAMSTESRVLVQHDGTIVSWWGAIPVDGVDSANVWLLNGPEVKRNPITWSKLVQEELARLSSVYGYLFAYADARNTDHHRWLERIDFRRLQTVEDYGVEHRPFHEYAGVFI